MDFLKQVRQGVDKAAAETEKQATIARLSVEVRGVRGNIQKKHEQLGQVAQKLYEDGELNNSDVEGIVEEIKGLEARIADIETRIAAVRAGERPA